MSITGGAPYRTPYLGDVYGGYIGLAGSWANWKCGAATVSGQVDAQDAITNSRTYHHGIGYGAFWFMAGPGTDPGYDGTAQEASAWGAAQARQALADIKELRPAVTYPVVFEDVELPGAAPQFTPAPDNGWKAVYTSPCTGVVKTRHIGAALDRADFDGFATYLTEHSSYQAGVYSSPRVWRSIFGTGAASRIPATYEWTYAAGTSSLDRRPDGWCLRGTKSCAQFFGGQTASGKYALIWQWSGGGATRNGYGDFDQIDVSRTP
ncbi:MAG TPA: hypothetical protein VGI58_03110 [Streptosporangiaceae bacterium]